MPTTGPTRVAGQTMTAQDINNIADVANAAESTAATALATAKNAKTVVFNGQLGTAYTVVLTDAGRTVEMNNAAANTVTLPAESTVTFPVGSVVVVAQAGAGQTSIAGAAGVTVQWHAGAPGTGPKALAGQHAQASATYRGSNVWRLTGSLAA